MGVSDRPAGSRPNVIEGALCCLAASLRVSSRMAAPATFAISVGGLMAAMMMAMMMMVMMVGARL